MRLRCPNCGQIIKVPKGKNVTCPKCKEVINTEDSMRKGNK